MQRSSKLAVTSVVAGLVLSSACVTSPTNPAAVADYDSPVSFQGYALVASDTMTLEVRNQSTGLWETVATTTAAATPTIPANILNGNPDLFAWSINARVAQRGVPATYCRWSPTCTEPPPPTVCEFSFLAQARVREGGSNAVTFDYDWTTCFNLEINAGTPFLQAAINCASDVSPILNIHYMHIC